MRLAGAIAVGSTVPSQGANTAMATIRNSSTPPIAMVDVGR